MKKLAFDNVLEMKCISKSFPGVKALDGVSLTVKKGEVHAVIGENGAGKSTLMNILSGVYQPDEGEIYYQGEKLILNDPGDGKDKGIAMIHQELSLVTNLTVMENMFLGRIPAKFTFIDRKKSNQKCKEILDSLSLDSIKPETVVSELNISHMQMVEIGKAISLKASILIMDEPTSSLTKSETEILFDTIETLKESGVSIIYISHRMDEIFSIADKITVLRDGQYITTVEKSETNHKQLISLMVGRDITEEFSRTKTICTVNTPVILEVDNLSDTQKIKNVSFKVHAGEIVALTGLVGSGRTEVLQTLFGYIKRTSGNIKVNGKDVPKDSVGAAIKCGLGLVPEGRKEQGLFLDMSVKDNISMTHLPKICKMRFIEKDKEKQYAKEYAEKLRIKTPSLEQLVINLSGGNQQKTIIARWLLNNPTVLCLDEPTHGVDVGAKSEIYNIINELAASGIGVLLVSSEMPEVITLADRVLVMKDGEISGELGCDEINQENIMSLAAL